MGCLTTQAANSIVSLPARLGSEMAVLKRRVLGWRELPSKLLHQRDELAGVGKGCYEKAVQDERAGVGVRVLRRQNRLFTKLKKRC